MNTPGSPTGELVTVPAVTGPLRQHAGDPSHVLLIERDQQFADALAERLTDSWPKLRVSRVSTMTEAESRLSPDVSCVVLDTDVSGDAGIDAVQQIRTLYPDLPIVALIVDGDDERGGEVLTAGAQGYLAKGASEGYAIARAIRHSVQRSRAERYARELAVLRFQSAETARVQRGLCHAC